MSCNCNGCGQPERLCRCPKGKGEAPKRAYIAECTDCDPCRPCESMVKICSFVTPTLTEGQKFRNSFVYNQEDDSVYYISDDGTPTRFGSSPMFINAFNPDDRKIPRQTVFDFANQKAYIYDPEGNYIAVDLGANEVGSSYHIYIPKLNNIEKVESMWPNGSYNFITGNHIEKPYITIKDPAGNTVLPENFAAELEKIMKAPIVVHVPTMEHVSINSAGDYRVIGNTFRVTPTFSVEGGFTSPIVDWGTDGGLLIGESQVFRLIVSATESSGVTTYDAEITLPVRVEAKA